LSTLQLAYRQYQRALGRWPKDVLRPTCQLQDAIQVRVEKELAQHGGSSAAADKDTAQVNALHALLDDRFSKKVRVYSRSLGTPRPTGPVRFLTTHP
jgi:cytochrome b pre-mRNA-processing protein 6